MNLNEFIESYRRMICNVLLDGREISKDELKRDFVVRTGDYIRCAKKFVSSSGLGEEKLKEILETLDKESPSDPTIIALSYALMEATSK